MRTSQLQVYYASDSGNGFLIIKQQASARSREPSKEVPEFWYVLSHTRQKDHVSEDPILRNAQILWIYRSLQDVDLG